MNKKKKVDKSGSNGVKVDMGSSPTLDGDGNMTVVSPLKGVDVAGLATTIDPANYRHSEFVDVVSGGQEEEPADDGERHNPRIKQELINLRRAAKLFIVLVEKVLKRDGYTLESFDAVRMWNPE